MLKSAKDMFEELGYEQEILENYFDRFIRYKKDAKRIVFRNDKKIIPYEDYGDMGGRWNTFKYTRITSNKPTM